METPKNESQSKRPPKPAQIPWMSLPNKDQLFLLALCRLSEPLSNTCLLPYIFYLMRSILLPDGSSSVDNDTARRISQYSGILVASFPLAQFATSMLWARAADSYGRRPTIIWAVCVSMLANAAFGFSRSFSALLFWRTIAGVANGNVGVMRTMTAEIVQERRFQTKAFLLLPLIFNSGMVAGLALGGCLADPVVNLPWLFGANGAFNVARGPRGVQWALDYPYALPALLNTFMLATSFVLSFLWLRETLEGQAKKRGGGLALGRMLTRKAQKLFYGVQGYSKLSLSVDSDDDETEDEERPMLKPPSRQAPIPSHVKTILTRDVIVALVSFGLLPLHNSAFMHIFPVFLSSASKDHRTASLLRFDGGLALSSPTIGLWLGLLGTCGILLQLFIYPRMQARFGTLGNFRIALFMFPVVYAVAPYLSFLGQRDGCGKWLAIGVVAWTQVMARTISIPSTVILLTNAAPAKHVLGRVHGAGNMLASLARAIGPALGGLIYAYGVDNNMLGAVWWMYLSVVAIVALIWSFKMRDIDV